jgi:hypothetical protein
MQGLSPISISYTTKYLCNLLSGQKEGAWLEHFLWIGVAINTLALALSNATQFHYNALPWLHSSPGQNDDKVDKTNPGDTIK